MSKTLNFDFHTIEVPQGTGRDFGDVLRVAQKVKNLTDRNRDVGSYPVRWEEISFRTKDSIFHGEVIKIRMDNLPSKAGIKTPVQDLDLNSDEGLGEGVAFLFDETRSLLLIQRNRYGLSADHLVAYFCNLTGQSRPVLAHPLVSTKGLQRLLGMRQVKRFDVKVALPRGYRRTQAASTSAFAAIDMLEQSDATSVSVSLTVGTSKSPLNLTTIRSWGKYLNGLFKQSGQSVKYINVRGTDEHGEPTNFNVLEDQLAYSEDFHETNKRRRVPLAARIRMLEAALAHHRQELNALFDHNV